MKKKYMLPAVLVVLVAAMVAVVPVFAQGKFPPSDNTGPLHEVMLETFAEAVGLSVEEVENLQASGQTLAQIARDQGFTDDEIRTLLDEAANKALTQAVTEGLITQNQAERMSSRQRPFFGQWSGPYGGNHDQMLEQLGLSQTELDELLASGLNMPEIFEQQGLEPGFGRGNDRGAGPEGMAEACGLSVEELQSRRAAGESLTDICPGLEFPEGMGPGHGRGRGPGGQSGQGWGQ
ncbi:MAG: hypothetical protein JXA13_12305 [Anaerolineales bacterium]|nr:hypothetical protein [Anaerolineales bacterium]